MSVMKSAGSLLRHTTMILGLIFSAGKFERICSELVPADSGVFDSVCLLKSDVSG